MSISMGIYFLWVFVGFFCLRSLAKQVIDFIKVTRSLAVAIQCYAVLRRQRELPPLTCLHKTGPWLAAISCYWLSLMRKILSMILSFHIFSVIESESYVFQTHSTQSTMHTRFIPCVVPQWRHKPCKLGSCLLFAVVEVC